ncbi:dihydrofolate reductase family protein [Rhodococcus sp. NPDC058521]|uniref:dihydrofolate reductase family protein n=1 Tax=Rhodococcus sp. NPDC058521 TaxID=3346536 RepID=UPI00364D17D7
MRKLVYYVGTTLDGYIAGPHEQVEFFPVSDQMTTWINERYPDTVPTHLRAPFGLSDAENQAFDTVVMGRGTYDPALTIGITSPYAHLRQYVVSNTLGDSDDPAVTVTTDPFELIRTLKKEPGLDIWLAGGGKLAGALLGEIDEMIIKRYPVVAGSGLSVFDGDFDPTVFHPTRSEHFDNGAVVTWFSRT